ncbi:hypothetical protein LUZ62_049538 [Rhynchospora pubera]|uniref:DUF4220 domain-containing protein n=1 Tax=Rhynchospora pubera TaxID=906938 RepID=A0AAV8FYH2_9POAL|nr:hypothetical protein LUZ62_049538 [Rhynchospora pubera]
MADQSAPQSDQHAYEGIFSEDTDKILIATVTCFTAFVLFLTFFIAATRFRLWHSNTILVSIPKLVDHPVTWLISFCAALFAGAPGTNEHFYVWMMVLVIAYDNVITISSGSFPGCTWLIQEYISLFNSIYIGIFITKEPGSKETSDPYRLPLLILWSLLLTKFLIRLVLHKLVKRAYGINNSKVVSDYMKIEHELAKPNEVLDPKCMKGYKYLVVGEGNIHPKINNGPDYTPKIELPAGVVTLDQVWNCKERLLDPSIDADGRLREVCLSFAFFKLLKRRFFYYPAAEAQLEKTRQLVFEGLLSRNNDSIYRVIAMEIAFLRDFFYTRYPVTFALGVPILHVILLVGMFGVSLWISVKSFYLRDPDNTFLWKSGIGVNIDYTITNVLLIMMTLMEALETLFYVFSDWTKVLFICGHVRRWIPHPHCFFDPVIAILCKGKFSRSINNTIGQYSLLENYNRFRLDCRFPLTCIPYSTWAWSPSKVAPSGTKKRKPVVLSEDVKKAIVGSLRSMSHYPTKGDFSLKQNRVYDDLGWTCKLKTEFHTLIVWHIATGLCEIQPVKDKGNKKSVQPDHRSVASHLSNYCAYLMVFLPDMLPESIFSLKLFFRKVLTETKEFFHGARNNEDKYNFMLQVGDSGNGVIDMGARLAKYLMEKPDDTRWKIMADFWSEFIVFLAPAGKEEEHLKNLESGGEFITHLWALLYHAGIVHDTATASSGHHP